MAFTKRDIDAARAARAPREATQAEHTEELEPEEPQPEILSAKLSEEDRTRIYEEEKARIEARGEIKAKRQAKGLLILIVLFVLGYWVYKQDAYKRAHAAPEWRLSAGRLYADYQANEVAADVQYRGKILEVSGVVADVSRDILDHIYVTFSIGTPLNITTVQSFFDDAFAARIGQIQKGQYITIKCRCDGKFANVLLRDCVPY